MKRHFTLMNKPVTWGGYFKLAGICAVIGTAITGIGCVLLMEPTWWKATKDFVKRLLGR